MSVKFIALTVIVQPFIGLAIIACMINYYFTVHNICIIVMIARLFII